MYVQSFTVRGAGQFPYDMLRYDRCFPASEVDAGQLEREVRGGREVKLVRYQVDRKREPTVERWASFRWEVLPESVKTEKM